ncbi:MAG: hypothetical protein PHV42_01730 [Candidatus Pacebacteria bacterium]|nr:hypothetical protein [Candidatus Paceibacterota bacterium]
MDPQQLNQNLLEAEALLEERPRGSDSVIWTAIDGAVTGVFRFLKVGKKQVILGVKFLGREIYETILVLVPRAKFAIDRLKVVKEVGKRHGGYFVDLQSLSKVPAKERCTRARAELGKVADRLIAHPHLLEMVPNPLSCSSVKSRCRRDCVKSFGRISSPAFA